MALCHWSCCCNAGQEACRALLGGGGRPPHLCSVYTPPRCWNALPTWSLTIATTALYTTQGTVRYGEPQAELRSPSCSWPSTLCPCTARMRIVDACWHTRMPSLGRAQFLLLSIRMRRMLHTEARAAQVGRNTWLAVALATPRCAAETVGAESSRLDDVPCKTSAIASHTNVPTLADRTKRRRFGRGVSWVTAWRLPIRMRACSQCAPGLAELNSCRYAVPTHQACCSDARECRKVARRQRSQHSANRFVLACRAALAIAMLAILLRIHSIRWWLCTLGGHDPDRSCVRATLPVTLHHTAARCHYLFAGLLPTFPHA